uniref:Neprilysin-2 n=1 Tax=Anoplophora glabripennis TaxID=217634 RepID=V5GXP8_ANOGL
MKINISKTIVVLFAVLSCLIIGNAADDEVDESEIPELQYMNRSVDPCDDFYEYVCGNFPTVHPLPSDTLVIDQFSLLENSLVELATAILSSNDAVEDPVALKKARGAYKACIDVDYVDSLVDPEVTIVVDEGGFPLVENSSSTVFGWNEIGEAVGKYGVPMIFTIETFADLTNASKNMIRIYSDNVSNPTLFRPYTELSYEEVLEKGFLSLEFQTTTTTGRSVVLKPFDIFLRTIAFKVRNALGSFLSDEEVIENINVMANFMRGVYQGGYVPENVTVEDFKGMSITLAELNAWTKAQFGDTIQMDWVEYLRRVFKNSGTSIDETTEVVTSTNTSRLFYGVLNWVSMNKPETIKNFVLMRTFLYMAPDSDAETRAAFEQYYRQINLSVLPRAKFCTRKVIDAVGTASLSFAVAYEYQLRYFNVNKFAKAIQMIKDIKNSFTEIMNQTTWMDEQSKTVAIQKINNLVTIMGYPDFVSNKTLLDRFYENVRICKWDNYGNSRRIRAFKQAYQISQVEKRDRTFWDKSPFEVNAYYNRPNNKIIFPVAVLNPIFFGSNLSVLDYGRIGSVIGHEITHGFDYQGQMYNQDGLLQQWWSNETRAAFKQRMQCFVDQYNQYYIPEIDDYVNGSTTLNENIADNGGARESYNAMKKFLERTGQNQRTKNFSADQLFFIGFGTMWCNNPSKEYLLVMQDDDHARAKWRVNGVLSNMEQFSEAFSCKAGTNMNPEQRCRLW